MRQYHERVIESLMSLKLNTVLKRKNPYLFKAKATETACDLVRAILDAYLSSQEEGIFGGLLEDIAVYVCGKAFNGKKSSAEGIDLEFTRDGIHHIVSIKSGPNWGNSQQIKRMRDNFRKARRILGTNTVSCPTVLAINGCCYGKERRENKDDYVKLCGQRFWECISGDDDFYLELIEPIGWNAKKRTEKFKEEYSKVVNRFTIEFSRRFCSDDGSLLWCELVRFNSGETEV